MDAARRRCKRIIDEFNNDQELIGFVDIISNPFLYGNEFVSSINWDVVQPCDPCCRHNFPTIRVCVSLKHRSESGEIEPAGSGFIFIKEDQIAWEEDNYLHQVPEKYKYKLRYYYDTMLSNILYSISIRPFKLD